MDELKNEIINNQQIIFKVSQELILLNGKINDINNTINMLYDNINILYMNKNNIINKIYHLEEKLTNDSKYYIKLNKLLENNVCKIEYGDKYIYYKIISNNILKIFSDIIDIFKKEYDIIFDINNVILYNKNIYINTNDLFIENIPEKLYISKKFEDDTSPQVSPENSPENSE